MSLSTLLAFLKTSIYHKNMELKGNSLVITNAAGEYLMQFRDDNPGISRPLAWDFFGGGIENNESVLESAARELHEELGIEATPEQFEVAGEYTYEKGTDIVIRFQKNVEWGEFILLEGAGCGFFTKQELLQLSLDTRGLDIVTKYYQ